MIDNQTFKIIDRLLKIVFTQRGISSLEPNGAIACPIANLLQSFDVDEACSDFEEI